MATITLLDTRVRFQIDWMEIAQSVAYIQPGAHTTKKLFALYNLQTATGTNLVARNNNGHRRHKLLLRHRVEKKRALRRNFVERGGQSIHSEHDGRQSVPAISERHADDPAAVALADEPENHRCHDQIGPSRRRYHRDRGIHPRHNSIRL
jgi:hypothetical protein